MNPHLPLANLNGAILPLGEVRISALDRGFLFGDAIYEVLRLYSGKPFLVEEHFQRLGNSLEAIRLSGIDLPRLRRRMMETIEQSGVSEGMVYLQITRGSAPRKHPFPKDAVPLELLWVQEFSDPYREQRQTGIGVITQPDIRWKRCDIKTTNLLGNVLAMQAAVEAGCTEALFYHEDGRLIEGTHTNLFGVARGKLITAPTTNHILPGCTRAFILRLAQVGGIGIEEGYLNRDSLGELAELFVSGTTSEVLPVVRVDEVTIGPGTPGPVARRLQQLYADAVADFV
jgi:D-alanine transaminase